MNDIMENEGIEDIFSIDDNVSEFEARRRTNSRQTIYKTSSKTKKGPQLFMMQIKLLNEELELKNNKILEYISSVDIKNKEVQKIRKELVDIRETDEYISMEEHENELDLLRIDIKHLKSNMESQTKTNEKKI